MNKAHKFEIVYISYMFKNRRIKYKIKETDWNILEKENNIYWEVTKESY